MVTVTKRYVVMTAEQASEAGFEDVWEPDDDYYEQDLYLYRDLRVFVDELNRVANE